MKDPRAFRILTGLSIEHFNELLPYFKEAHDQYFRYRKLDGKPNVGIRPPRIYRTSPLPSIEDRLYFILYYLKNNPLQEAMADRFDMDKGQCNRWIHCLYAILRQSLKEMEVAPASNERELAILYQRAEEDQLSILIHDGTERPMPRPVDNEQQKEVYSGKKKTHTVKNGVITSVIGGIYCVKNTH